MDFDFLALFAEGWIWSDADGCGPCVPVDGGGAGIDAVSGQQGVNLCEVCGGKADCSSALGTAVDESADAIWVSEQSDGFCDSAATQQAADATGGDHFGAIIGGGRDPTVNSGIVAELPQGVDGSGAIVAEMEIGAFHDTAGLKPGLNDLSKELLWCELQQAGADREDEDCGDAGFQQQSATFIGGGEQWWCEFRTEHGDGVWIEGDSNGRHGELPGEFKELLQHADVSQMDTIEIADADAGAVQ